MNDFLPENRSKNNSLISVYPGISAVYNDFKESKKEFHHDEGPFIMEVSHCHYGRVGWDLNNGTSVYMGEGDAVIHSTVLCSNSVKRFPLGFYQGFTITMDFNIISEEPPEIIKNAGIDLKKTALRFFETDRSFLYVNNKSLEHIFEPLYHLPENLRLPFLRLKVQELLLFLTVQTSEPVKHAVYNSDITETIRKIHTLLTENLEKRYTINDISGAFLINTTTLKTVFKAVYGMPVAAYMKEYRIRHAAKLLRHTEAGIAEISAKVGYETQSKFTKAFKDIIGTTPSDFRRKN
ncbi:MAG: AraC family transcriptional regulator [Clostridiales bacterium]|nr:AraC family transcriptional regulator [Clostridiales bacterium]